MCDVDGDVLRMMPLVYVVSGTRWLLVVLVFNFHVIPSKLRLTDTANKNQRIKLFDFKFGHVLREK